MYTPDPIFRHSHFTPSSFEQWQSQHLPGATSVRRRGDGRDGVRKKEGIPAVEISCVAVSQGAMKHVHQIGEMRMQRWNGVSYWVRWASELVIRLLFPLKKGMDMVYNVYMIYGFNLLAMHNIRKDDHPAGHHSSMASQWLFKRMIWPLSAHPWGQWEASGRANSVEICRFTVLATALWAPSILCVAGGALQWHLLGCCLGFWLSLSILFTFPWTLLLNNICGVYG